MPIRESTDPASAEDVKGASEDFLIFMSSRNEEGKLWCPDCVAVEDLIQTTFQSDQGPSAFIVYVGQKPAWKSPTNMCRSEPFNVKSIPTIIRRRDDERLVEEEITRHSLASFTEL